MYPKKDSFSVVVLGSWNPSIFHQNWILQHLTQPKTENLIIAFPIEDPTAPRKISFEGINLFPGRKQILLQPDEPTIDGINKCGSILARILDLLGHTPVGACGINFAFEEADKQAKIFEVLNLPDTNAIDAEQYAADGVTVTRRFRLADGNLLNLSLSNLDDKMQIGFNFHYESNDIVKYREMFVSDHIAKRYQQAVDFCGNAYGLELEEVNNA